MKNLKIRFAAGCMVVVMIVALCNFLLVNDVNSYVRVSMDELSDDGSIDVLFIGASCTQAGYDVNLIEENTGENAFTMGSSIQSLAGSYYMLRQANEDNGVKTVWLDMNYVRVNLEESSKWATYLAADHLKNLGVKYTYLLDELGIEGVVNGLLPFFHGASLKSSTIKAHITRDYIKNPYKYVTYSNEGYSGQGHTYKNSVLKENATFEKRASLSEENQISEYSWKYLKKIMEYCNKNDIELVFACPPVADGMLVAEDGYQYYVDWLKETAEEYGITCYDFTLAKKDLLAMERTDFADGIHLNSSGAEKFSTCVSKILNGELDTADAFYDTFAEKLANNPDGTAN